MARDLMPGWIRTVASFNPLNWSLDSARAALAADPDWATVTVHGGWLLGLAVLMIWLSTRSFRGYQKSI
jgi:ABC-2 type transport system permease protein